MTIANASPRLYNEDLAPARERNWGAFSIFNVWTSDVHSLWGYYLAASLFLICGNFVNFIFAIGIGSLVIFLLMNLVGFAGVKTGVLAAQGSGPGDKSRPATCAYAHAFQLPSERRGADAFAARRKDCVHKLGRDGGAPGSPAPPNRTS
jgi:hypothetical protein